jgi:uncharacterized membrane protein
VTVPTSRALDTGQAASVVVAVGFFAICTATSWARWANFEYRTFDLAYYVQALWQLIHGRFDVSVEGVPLLGNHVEPIVFLIAPLFALIRHPMIFVIVQNGLLAAMAPVGFGVARRLGMDRPTAFVLGSALLLAPAAGYIALHEFHPEALAAPFLLLVILARLTGSLRAYWGWLIALLACKENLALLAAAYCVVNAIAERKRPWQELRAWYLWPLVLSILWFLACTKVITPALNAGNIDYFALYDQLGTSPGDMALKAITEPGRIINSFARSLAGGNLIWALLLPYLFLPLFSPRWLLIASPILLQHLLSWRSSEWMIYFHYAAPLLPLVWIALAESLAALQRRTSLPAVVPRAIPYAVIAACLVAQFFLGPAAGIMATAQNWAYTSEDRVRKIAFLSEISPTASVAAPLPYLSHLATRPNLFSLHYILKGLKTLGRSNYEPPPPTDFVLIDYDDSATFDPGAGYYHPRMKTVDGRTIPSSDKLLHDFLSSRSWSVSSANELTLLRQTTAALNPTPTSPPPRIEADSKLISCTKSESVLAENGIEIVTSWGFSEPRDTFPWLFLKLVPHGPEKPILLSRGLCSPESVSPMSVDRWRITPSPKVPVGDYTVEALFVDNSTRLWLEKSGAAPASAYLITPPVLLGELRVTQTRSAHR